MDRIFKKWPRITLVNHWCDKLAWKISRSSGDHLLRKETMQVNCGKIIFTVLYDVVLWPDFYIHVSALIELFKLRVSVSSTSYQPFKITRNIMPCVCQKWIWSNSGNCDFEVVVLETRYYQRSEVSLLSKINQNIAYGAVLSLLTLQAISRISLY